MNKPEDRLLTDNELAKFKAEVVNKDAFYHSLLGGDIKVDVTELLKLQDAKTASIYEARVEKIFEEIEDTFRLKGATLSHIPKPGKPILSIKKEWQALKSRQSEW